MSATLNFNQQRYISWKGKTFSQVTTTIRKNTGTIGIKQGPVSDHNTNIKNIFLATPLKLYRREIVTVTPQTCNSRTAISIDELNMPNGYLVYNTKSANGLNSTLDINLVNSKYETMDKKCNTSTACFNPAKNALRRVRSSGMIPKKFNAERNNDHYYTNTTQYLTSRNMTFQQNQFNYLKSGNVLAEPGTTNAINNVYNTQGFSHCKNGSYVPVIYKPNNSQFAQQGAVDSSSLITRRKYDTLTGVGSKLKTPDGYTIKNTLAYAVPTGTFATIKKAGNPFPIKSTPVFCPRNNNKSVTMCKTA